MIDKEKCSSWVDAMFNLMTSTKELTDDEAEYIKQWLKIYMAEEKLKELEKKNEVQV